MNAKKKITELENQIAQIEAEIEELQKNVQKQRSDNLIEEDPKILKIK